MTPNAAKLQRICQNNDMPVLYINDPDRGDRFEFGTPKNSKVKQELGKEKLEKKDDRSTSKSSEHQKFST